MLPDGGKENSMIRIAICDDNELQVEATKDIVADLLEKSGRTAEIASFFSGSDLVRHVRENRPYDLYILDLIMPGMNGMETATSLRLMKDKGAIVFLSASTEYAVQSYEVDAEYYFLKPLEPLRFSRVLDRVLERLSEAKDTVEINGQDGVIVLPQNSILYVRLDDRRPKFQLADGRFIMGRVLRGKFHSEIQTLLKNPAFTECGVGMVLNLAMVDMMDSESVLMKNGDVLYPPKSAVAPLMNAWLDWRKRT